MESNKLLIGAQFIDENDSEIVIELIVLRDMKLKQLLDGILYGLAKRIDVDVYKKCKDIFDSTVIDVDDQGVFQKITLTSHSEDKDIIKDEKNRVILKYSDLNRTLTDVGFISSTRIVFDYNGFYPSYGIDTSSIIPAFDPGNRNKTDIVFPDYNISSRQLYKFDNTPVEIIQPSDPPRKNSQNLFFMLLPTILMISTMILVRGVILNNSGNGRSNTSLIILSVSMSVVTLTTSIINWFYQKSKHKKDTEQWRKQYEEYINRTIADIKIRKERDSKNMCSIYPDVVDLFNTNSERNVYSLNGEIYNRSHADTDFLSIRIGQSDQINNFFEIQGNLKDAVFSPANFTLVNDQVSISIPEDENFVSNGDKRRYLCNLPGYLSEKYKYMENAPLLIDLKNSGTIGITSDNISNTETVVERMIFDLCYHHSPDELQFIILFKQASSLSEIEDHIRTYKFLPHFRGLFNDRSQFVFDYKNALSVFSAMLNIASSRAENANAENASPIVPHIVFVVFEEYGIKEHAFAQFLPALPPEGKAYEDKLGFTFIFAKRYREHLPQYCSSIIELYNSSSGRVIPHDDLNMKKDFKYNICANWYSHLYNSYKILSALCYSKISQNGKVPSNVSLFELYGLSKETLDISKFWNDNNDGKRVNIIDSMSVPIGKTEKGITYLDLHEKSDGPHMLVAGTTGSGKSETIITYLLGLCLSFRPDEINLMLVDMKGGGFINRIGTLPHVVGSVTDVDGDENGTGSEYMLKRFLNALSSEIRRRKILFNSMYVDSINGYISACRNIESHIKSINNRLKGENKSLLNDKEIESLKNQAKKQPLAHLMLVVDEFTELKRFTNENNDIDFIAEITTIARVGRSLGLHIILISQNIEGAITDDIRVNSKSRLCLKVATRQASKEMIGNDLAASPTMPGNGRGYLLVGTGSKFEYFQSGYAGAGVHDNLESPVEIIEASKKDAYTVFYKSEKDNTEYINKKRELEDQGMLETQLNAVVGAIKTYYDENTDKFTAPHIVFQQPLPNKMILEDNKIYSYHDGKYKFMREV